MEANASGDAAQVAALPKRGNFRRHRRTVGIFFWFHHLTWQEPDLSLHHRSILKPTRLIDRLRMDAICMYSQTNEFISCKRWHAWEQQVRPLQSSATPFQTAEPILFTSTLWIGMWYFITNARSYTILTASQFKYLELCRFCQSNSRPQAQIQSQTTRISDGRGFYLCVFCSCYRVFGSGATWQLWTTTLFCQSMQM